MAKKGPKSDLHKPPAASSGADILDGTVNEMASIHPSMTDATGKQGNDVGHVDMQENDKEARDEPSELPKRHRNTSNASQVSNASNSPSIGHSRAPRQPRKDSQKDSQSSHNHTRNDSQSHTHSAPSSRSQSRKGSVDEMNHRPNRKSSVSRRYKRTACFVHSLLEVQQRFEKSNIHSMPASENPSRPVSPGGRDPELLKQANESKKDLFGHLSKKEISDMALGVRELSKHLGSARLKLNINRILIVTKTGDKSLVPLMTDLATWLLKQRKEKFSQSQGTPNGKDEKPQGYTVYVEKTFEEGAGMASLHKDSFPGKLKYWTAELCSKSPHLFDFVITLGGDGTVLYTSWLFQKIVPPVLSFALGSLGFLTTFDFKDHEGDISGVLQDGVTAALRMRIECQLFHARREKSGELKYQDNDLHEDIIHNDHHGESAEPTHVAGSCYTILNDLVVDRGPNPFMSSTELYGDDEHMTSIAADGVCISTPTGSTAYSLSAGGSLCHPEIPAILISPICPHTLSFRPLLVPDSMVLRVAVPYDSRSTAWASFDGRNRNELKQGDYVRISASRFPFPTVLRGRQTGDWFESISRTLNWNERKKQKSV